MKLHTFSINFLPYLKQKRKTLLKEAKLNLDDKERKKEKEKKFFKLSANF